MEQIKLSIDKLADLKTRAIDDIKASNELGHIYKAGSNDEPMSYEKAHQYFSMGAEKGDQEAQTQLGIMFEKGQFVKCDYEKAIEWYQKAANQGYPEAQSHLGRMYYEGKGIEKDEVKGIEWLVLASRNGFMQAKHFIDEINRSKQKSLSKEEQPTKAVYKPKESDQKTNTAFSCNNVTGIPQAECEALVNFYHRTSGDNWDNNEGWLQTNQPCHWYGTECENNSITKLDLWKNQLSGTILDLSALTQLRTLSLSNNQLSGTIPDLSALTQLQALSLSRNNFCHNPNINYEKWNSRIEEYQYPACE
ncbi:leucine-rich repeat domain-containing protein [Candidatus Albibeggiatoa sp. nov. NOAA]|uniref:tetratricopeptide repeat protein n=1 Tax=Candidatus Albibeggiatoa sp. nov. NOAA TaxID=3162724 RepID=UPI0032FEBCF0|nr:hypothetical protein [Thiotrichaceae bacterium]